MWCLGVPGSGEQAVGGPSCPACPPKPPQAARWDYWGSSSCPSVPLWGLSTALARRAESSWAAAKARAHHPKIGPGMAVLRVTLGPKRERVGQGGSEPPQWFCGVFPLIFCAPPPPLSCAAPLEPRPNCGEESGQSWVLAGQRAFPFQPRCCFQLTELLWLCDL